MKKLSLIERAQRLTSNKIAVGAAVILPLAAAESLAEPSFAITHAGVYYDVSGFISGGGEVSGSSAGAESLAGGSEFKLYGTSGLLGDSQLFQSTEILLLWEGTFSGTVYNDGVGNFTSMAFDYEFDVDLVNNSGLDLDYSWNLSGELDGNHFTMAEAFNHTASGDFSGTAESQFLTWDESYEYTNAPFRAWLIVSGSWMWDTWGPSDTIKITVPQNSIDGSVVPEPSSTGLLLGAVAGLALFGRRLKRRG